MSISNDIDTIKHLSDELETLKSTLENVTHNLEDYYKTLTTDIAYHQHEIDELKHVQQLLKENINILNEFFLYNDIH